MTSGIGIGDGMRHARRVVVLLAFAIVALACLPFAGCTSPQTHDLALLAASQNAQLASARTDEMRSFVLAVDARERKSLNIQLDLTTQLGEQKIDAEFAKELALATETLAPAGGAGQPVLGVGESRPVVGATLDNGAPPRRVVSAAKVAALVAKQNADRDATRKEVAAKRAEITAQLDRELKAWLDDPKARQQERLAAALSVYARQQSEFARFWQDFGAKVGVEIPGSTP